MLLRQLCEEIALVLEVSLYVPQIQVDFIYVLKLIHVACLEKFNTIISIIYDLVEELILFALFHYFFPEYLDDFFGWRFVNLLASSSSHHLALISCWRCISRTWSHGLTDLIASRRAVVLRDFAFFGALFGALFSALFTDLRRGPDF